MKIKAIVWLPEIIEKLETKHGVIVEEVEEVFELKPLLPRGQRGKRKGEHLYQAFGQTFAGRYLFVVFIYKLDQRILILSARDMDEGERRLYRRR